MTYAEWVAATYDRVRERYAQAKALNPDLSAARFIATMDDDEEYHAPTEEGPSMPSTGNRLLDFFVFVIVIIVALIVLFRVLDILDDEADSDGAFFDSYVTEVVG